MKIEFVAAVDAAEIVAVPVFEERALTSAGSALDGKAGGALTKAMTKGRFTGKAGQSLLIAAPTGVDADSVLLDRRGRQGQAGRSGGRGLRRFGLCGGQAVGRRGADHRRL